INIPVARASRPIAGEVQVEQPRLRILKERRATIAEVVDIDVRAEWDWRLPTEVVVLVAAVSDEEVVVVLVAVWRAGVDHPVAVGGEGRGEVPAGAVDRRAEVDRRPPGVVLRVPLRHPQVEAELAVGSRR